MSFSKMLALAKEAGFFLYDLTETHGMRTVESDDADQWAQLERFAELVAAQEREACAQVCDAKAHEVRLWCNEVNVLACAADIRARGTKEGA